MFGLKRVVIAQFQRGLKFRDGRLSAILEPGVHRYLSWRDRTQVVVEDITRPEANFPRADLHVAANPALCDPHLQLVALSPQEAGLVRKQGRLTGILVPGTRQVYWRGAVAVEVARVDVGNDLEVAPALLGEIQSAVIAGALPATQVAGAIVAKDVPEQSVGLLLVDGKYVRTLATGRYAFWRFTRNVAVDVIDLRVTAIDVQGQEILTRDKVSLRANLAASFRVVDPLAAKTALVDYKDTLYRELQFGLRQAIGTRTLDALLGNKGELDEAVFAYASGRLAGYGLELVGVGVKDLILPGEMKEILNQVVQAEKVAQANVIRRREETAATRSLLNTAKLMDESPVLLRLKELETLEKVTEKIDRLTVFGGLDGVLGNLVNIARK